MPRTRQEALENHTGQAPGNRAAAERAVPTSTPARGRPRVASPAAGLAIALLLSAALTACNSKASEQLTPATEHIDQSPASTATAGAAPGPTSTAPVTQYTFKYTDEGGVTIDGVLQLAATMQASDPRVGATWSSLAPDAPGSPMCVNEPTRDGVVVGAVSFTNETPTYPPTNVVIPLFGSTSDINAQLSFEIHYANSDANCAYVNPGDAVIRPEMSGATWGPVPVAFVIPNMYGPDGPDMTTFETAQSDLALGPSNQNMEAGAGMTDQGGYYLHFTLPPPSS